MMRLLPTESIISGKKFKKSSYLRKDLLKKITWCFMKAGLAWPDVYLKLSR